MPRFDDNDSDVVVVVGSGAGGGTLANELCQGGVKTVVLEAGAHHKPDEFIDDEWPSFGQIAWLDDRTTSGSWRVATDFPSLPAWTCKTVGGTSVHWAGCCPRFKDWEFRNRSEHGPVDGTSMLDWPIGLADVEPYYDRAEDKLGVTRTNGVPPLPANNNFKVMGNGGKRAGFKDVSTGRMATNSVPRDGRPATIQDGFNFQGDRQRAHWSTLTSELPKAEATGKLDLRPSSHAFRIAHDGNGKVTAVHYFDADGNRARAEGARGVRGRQRDRDRRGCCCSRTRRSTPTAWPTPPGRWAATTCATSPARSTASSISRCTCTAARRWPGSSPTRRATTRTAASSAATTCSCWRSACRSYAAFLDPGGWGPDFAARHGGLRARGGHVARRRGHAAGDQPRDAEPRRDRPARPAGAERALRRPPQRRRDARARLPVGRVGLRRGRRGARQPRDAVPVNPQPGHLPDERATRRTGSSTSSGGRTTCPTCSSRTGRSSRPAPRRTRP